MPPLLAEAMLLHVLYYVPTYNVNIINADIHILDKEISMFSKCAFTIKMLLSHVKELPENMIYYK